mgnify:FL=1
MKETSASVLMTVYNDGGRLLEESILSVIKQKRYYDQFVIVNDGSSDSSKQIIEKYLKDYTNKIEFIDREENIGRAYSLNEGLNACKGELVFINDADDFSEENRFKKTIEYYDKHKKNKKIAVIGGKGIISDGKTKNKYYRFFIMRNGIIPKSQVYYGMPFIHSSCAYVREKLVFVGGFPTEISSCIDYFTIIKLSALFNIIGLNEYLVVRNKDGKNFFTQKKIENQYNKNLSLIDEWKRKNYPNSKMYEFLKVTMKNIWKIVKGNRHNEKFK